MQKCPHCEETLNITPDITTGEYDGYTCDCPKCGGLLLITDGDIELPHWLKAGEKSSYVEFYCEDAGEDYA